MISAGSFYERYHGHSTSYLRQVLDSQRKAGKSCIFLAGDSSLDNKHWFFDGNVSKTSQMTDDSFTARALNGYEKILKPARMVQDVSFWLNHELSRNQQNTFALNCAIEESTLGERSGDRLMEQDIFIRENISESDTLVVSVGGNDIALRPSMKTIANMLTLVTMNSIESIQDGSAWGLSHFFKLFRDDVQSFLERLTAKRRPKKVPA